MDLQAALAHTSQYHVANIVGLQLHGRSIEVFRPRFCEDDGKCQIEYREGMLFQDAAGAEVIAGDDLSDDAAQVDYFVAPFSEDELDVVFRQRAEVILHRLLEGAPSPEGCDSPRQKAAFTSWCIETLARRNR